MTLANRSARAAVWEFSSVILQAAAQFLVMAVLARLLTPADFGLYAITTIVLGVIEMFAEIGVGSAVLQKKEPSEVYIQSAYTLSFLLAVAGIIFTWVCAPWAAAFFRQPEATNLIRAASLALLMSAYVTISTALFERELQYKTLAIVNIASYTIGFGLVGIGLALARMGPWAIIGASLAQNLLRAILLYWIVRKPIKFRLSMGELRSLLGFGTGISLARIINYGAHQIDSVLVGRLIGSFELGLYQMAFNIVDLPRRFLGSVIDRVGFAAMTHVQDDQSRLRAGYLGAVELANIALLPVAVFLIFATPEFVRGILGEQWIGMVLPLQIMLTQIPLRASIRMTDALCGAVGQVYRLASTKVIYFGMICVVVFVGIRWGLTGVAAGVTLAVIVNWLIMVGLALRITRARIPSYLGTWIPGTTISAVTAIVTFTGLRITRTLIGSDLLRLCALGIFLACVLLSLFWIHPNVIGNTAISLIVDFGRQSPVFPKLFISLERRLTPERTPGALD